MKAVIFDFNRTLYDPDSKSLVKGAIASLHQLKKANYLLFLIGKGTSERADLINELGLSPYFEEIIVKEEKDLEDFQYLKNKYPQAVFYVFGDRVRKEITFGNACGFKTIWFKNGKFATETPEAAEEIPWKTVESFEELDIALNET